MREPGARTAVTLLDGPDGDVYDLGSNPVDPEVLRRVELDPKIVPAGSKTGKIDKRVNRLGAYAGEGLTTAAHANGYGIRNNTWYAQSSTKIPRPHEHTFQLPFHGCRHDVDDDRDVLRLNQAHGRIGQSDRDHVPDVLTGTRYIDRLGRGLCELLDTTFRPHNFNGCRLRRDLPDHESGRRISIDRCDNGNDPLEGLFELDTERARHDLSDFDAER